MSREWDVLLEAQLLCPTIVLLFTAVWVSGTQSGTSTTTTTSTAAAAAAASPTATASSASSGSASVTCTRSATVSADFVGSGGMTASATPSFRRVPTGSASIASTQLLQTSSVSSSPALLSSTRTLSTAVTAISSCSSSCTLGLESSSSLSASASSSSSVSFSFLLLHTSSQPSTPAPSGSLLPPSQPPTPAPSGSLLPPSESPGPSQPSFSQSAAPTFSPEPPGSTLIVIELFINVLTESASEVLNDAVNGSPATGSLLRGLALMAGVPTSHASDCARLSVLRDVATGEELRFTRRRLSLRQLQGPLPSPSSVAAPPVSVSSPPGRGTAGFAATIALDTVNSSVSMPDSRSKIISGLSEARVLSGPLALLARAVGSKYGTDPVSVYSLQRLLLPPSATPVAESLPIPAPPSASVVNIGLLVGVCVVAGIVACILLSLLALLCSRHRQVHSDKDAEKASLTAVAAVNDSDADASEQRNLDQFESVLSAATPCEVAAIGVDAPPALAAASPSLGNATTLTPPVTLPFSSGTDSDRAGGLQSTGSDIVGTAESAGGSEAVNHSADELSLSGPATRHSDAAPLLTCT
jgi:hypothetical protein